MLKESPKTNKRLIYIVPFYVGYRMSSFNPLMNDMVVIDWQLRLLSFLKNLKFEVFVKQHPESNTRMPEYFFQEIGVQDLNGNFEDVVHPDDICIFDWQSTTTFGAALKQNNPIVFINFGTQELHENERTIMHQRLVEIDGFYDARNRADIEWSSLNEAIQVCQNLNDKKFVKLIYGSV
tara:strand:+ start:2642 stop:3178 length:537 start_codon:yes stop_codon:yes gene_type:complete